MGAIEMLATLAIIAVAVGIVAPSVRDLLVRSEVAALANDLVHVLGAARSEALVRGAPVTVCTAHQPGAVLPACTGAGKDWSRGWIVVAGDGTSGTSPLRRRVVGAGSPAVIASAPVGWKLTFAPTGQPVGAFAGGSFRICPLGRPELGRAVVVSRAARIRVVAEPCAS
jgi:type IV fimbrial biogenesis protein FimT